MGYNFITIHLRAVKQPFLSLIYQDFIEEIMRLAKTFIPCFLSTLLWACSSQPKVDPLEPQAIYPNSRELHYFADYVDFLKRKAAGQGVSSQTLQANQNIRYIQQAVDLDRKQAARPRRDPSQPRVANPNGATNYLKRVLTNNKVEVASRRYVGVQSHVKKASQKYGVQPEYLMALWGMESSFGYYQGNYDVLSVLATLAFEGRREILFSQEFINAMKMLEQGDINRKDMLGSWAGAMGQTQFMPTSYLNYAVDGNNDGVKNIWQDPADVFASIANYLSTVGWDNNLPWGVEVEINGNLPLALAGTEPQKSRSLQAWQAQSIRLKTRSLQELQKWNALANADLWLIRPDQEKGRAFLVSNNFRTLLNWNRSNYFALSIGMFADRIQQRIRD